MTVTLNLPPDIERAFEGEAQARGLSLDELASEVILSRADQVCGEFTGASHPAQTVYEHGVPMLRTGQPIGIAIVDETLKRVRLARERAIVGA